MNKNKLTKVFAGFLVAFVAIVGMVGLYPNFAHAGNPSVDTSDTGVPAQNSTHNVESRATEANQSSLESAMPLPSPFSYSMERDNLLKKATFESQKGVIGYVALIGPLGQLVAYYTIQGKVSSLNSLLTTPQQVQCPNADTASNWTPDAPCVTVDSPDLDCSYGPNPTGIFFFTTSGQYVEWSGMYLYSNEPISYTTQPLLTEAQHAAK